MDERCAGLGESGMTKCNNCKNVNPTPQFKACPDCRAYWRAQSGLKTRRSKYQDLYERQQVEVHKLKKENEHMRQCLESIEEESGNATPCDAMHIIYCTAREGLAGEEA